MQFVRTFAKKLHMEKMRNYLQVIDRLLEQGPFKDKKHAVTLIARTLGISQTSVYNKLSDRCRFSLDEFSLICMKFSLSPDTLLLPTAARRSHFYCHHIIPDFLQQNLTSQWIKIADTWSSHLLQQNTILHIFPQTIALHHLSHFPHLIYLVLYYQQCYSVKENQFSQPYLPEPFIHNHATQLASQRIYHSFLNATFLELFHSSMLDGILSAYTELTAAGIIHKDHAAIQKEIENLLGYLEVKAANSGMTKQHLSTETQSKYAICQFNGPTDWILFHSKEKPPLARCMTGFGLGTETNDPHLLQHLSQSFETKWQQSTPISGAGAATRKAFFYQLRQKTLHYLTQAASALPHQEAYEPHGHPVPGNTHAAGAQYHLPLP